MASGKPRGKACLSVKHDAAPYYITSLNALPYFLFIAIIMGGWDEQTKLKTSCQWFSGCAFSYRPWLRLFWTMAATFQVTCPTASFWPFRTFWSKTLIIALPNAPPILSVNWPPAPNWKLAFLFALAVEPIQGISLLCWVVKKPLQQQI